MKSLEEAEEIAKRYIARKLNIDQIGILFDDSELTDIGVDRISIYRLSGHIDYIQKTVKGGFFGTSIGSSTTKTRLIQRFTIQVDAMEGKVVGAKIDPLTPAVNQSQ